MDYRGHNITHWDNIKTLGVKFRKSLGNNKYSAFPPGLTKLCNMLWLGRKFKLFSEGGGCFYRPDFYWGTKTGCNCRRCLTRFWIRFFNKQHYIHNCNPDMENCSQKWRYGSIIQLFITFATVIWIF